MPVPMLDIPAQNNAIHDQVMAAITPLIKAGQFILGSAAADFEAALADYCKVKHAIGVSSGTDALIIALMATDIGPGDQVIVPSFTFFATAGAVHRIGATPVFADIDPVTYNIDPASIEAAITDKTKAIIPVHLYGQCADMTAIMRIAKQHNLIVIEDTAQAIGARDADKVAGTIGHFGCLSFYPTKNLGAFGDAGAVMTNDDELAEKLLHLRLHGQTDAYQHKYVGGNFRIDSIQAAVLNVKLKHLDEYAAARRTIACNYHRQLKDLPIVLPKTAANNEPHDKNAYHVFNQFTIACDDRDALCEHLKQHDIGHKVFYPLPLHLQPCFEYLGYSVGQLPRSEQASRRVVSLPMFPEMTEQQQVETVNAIKSFYYSF